MWAVGFVEEAWAPPLRVSQREVLWQTDREPLASLGQETVASADTSRSA
jgi:hypothetical protein